MFTKAIPKRFITTGVSALVGVFCWVSIAQVDITMEQMTNSLINYEQVSKEQEIAAKAEEMFAQAPMLDATIQAGMEVYDSQETSEGQANDDAFNALVDALFPLSGDVEALEDEYDDATGDAAEGDDAVLRKVLPFLKEHLLYFCTPREYELVIGCQPSSAPGGDVSINSLLGNLEFETAGDLKAAKAVIKNLTYPTSLPVIRLKKNQDGEDELVDLSKISYSKQQTIVQGYATRTMTSAALHSLYNMYSMRVPNPDTGNISPMRLLESEASRRFNDPNWIAELASTPQTGVLREIAQIEAFKVYMDYLKLRQGERLEALIAALIASQATQSISISQQVAASQGN